MKIQKHVHPTLSGLSVIPSKWTSVSYCPTATTTTPTSTQYRSKCALFMLIYWRLLSLKWLALREELFGWIWRKVLFWICSLKFFVGYLLTIRPPLQREAVTVSHSRYLSGGHWHVITMVKLEFLSILKNFNFRWSTTRRSVLKCRTKNRLLCTISLIKLSANWDSQLFEKSVILGRTFSSSINQISIICPGPERSTSPTSASTTWPSAPSPWTACPWCDRMHDRRVTCARHPPAVPCARWDRVLRRVEFVRRLRVGFWHSDKMKLVTVESSSTQQATFYGTSTTGGFGIQEYSDVVQNPFKHDVFITFRSHKVSFS